MGNYTEFYYHFVWATKRREPLITLEVEAVLYDYIRHHCEALSVVVYAVNGMPDHLHLVCSLPAPLAVSEFVGKIKGASAWFINQKALRERNIRMCLYWQENYGGLTLEENILPRIVRYVDNQKQRHVAGRLSIKLEQCDDAHNVISSAPKGLPSA